MFLLQDPKTLEVYAADFLIDGPQLGFLGKVPGIYLLSLILDIVSFTRHAFSALCSTAVKFGPPTQDRNAARTLSAMPQAHPRCQLARPLH